MTKPIKDWRDRFKKLFGNGSTPYGVPLYANYLDIKDFIEKVEKETRQKTIAEVVEIVEVFREKANQGGYEAKPHAKEYEFALNAGAYEAISDLLQKLKDK